MILPALTGASLLIMAAGSPGTNVDVATQHLSSHQRTVAVQAYITRATECVAKTVAADPRYSGGNIGDLIVDSMPNCAALMRSMIDTYDQYFGNGTGEAFFSGPYLDVLPTAVTKWTAEPRP
ncbi:MAG: hypothetical protein QOG74_405 [Alphaproteobacteria bacterium]|jgi:hypothetical protein|nr:hypothetical protein [Alphaproteobacteria bacterium]MEA3023159.1 hypothetical protein [Alphaproteobacteria bacterium]